MGGDFRIDRRRFTTTLAAAMGASLFHPLQASASGPAHMQTILERYIAQGYATGMVAMTGVGDDVRVASAGHVALDSRAPILRDSIFRIASMTKAVTAVATLMLIEDGKLALNDVIDRWLPELSNRKVLRRIEGPLDDTVPAQRPTTIADLLTFRCGMGIFLVPPGTYPIQRKIDELRLLGFGPPDPAVPLVPDEWVKRLGTLPLMGQPGEAWMYNTGSYVLSVLLARASGQSLPQLFQERIFEPLGMVDTGFFAPAAKLSRLVTAYRPANGRLELYDAPAHSAWKTPPAFPDGGAGLVSTVDDFYTFSRFLLSRGRVGKRQLLPERAIAAMTTDTLTPQQRDGGALVLGRGHGWGYGVSVVVGDNAARLPPGTFGWNGGLGTSWIADPRSGRTTLLLTQTMFDSPDPPPVHTEIQRTTFA